MSFFFFFSLCSPFIVSIDFHSKSDTHRKTERDREREKRERETRYTNERVTQTHSRDFGPGPSLLFLSGT